MPIKSPPHQTAPTPSMRHQQRGFTLLELMIAMAIFALLAVAGWQVFDSVSRSKQRAKIQLDVLTELQYAYMQIQRDLLQAVPYQQSNQPMADQNRLNPSLQNTQAPDDLDQDNTQSPSSNRANKVPALGAFELNQNQLSFVRYADPDPRYAQPPSLERIVYLFNQGNLIRQRYQNLPPTSDERPLQSMVLTQVSAGQFQVLLPQPATRFTPSMSLASNSSADNIDGEDADTLPLLPKGVQLSFDIQLGAESIPISWVYALSPLPPKSVQSDDRAEAEDEGAAHTNNNDSSATPDVDNSNTGIDQNLTDRQNIGGFDGPI